MQRNTMKIDSTSDEWLTPQVAANMLGIHRSTLSRWAKANKISSRIINKRGDHRYNLSSIQSYIAFIRKHVSFT